MTLLFISGTKVALLFFLNLILGVFTIILASRKEIKFNFLIWVLLIVLLPFLGSITYLLKHLTTKKENHKIDGII
jgi:uncharacterized protein YqhQ